MNKCNYECLMSLPGNEPTGVQYFTCPYGQTRAWNPGCEKVDAYEKEVSKQLKRRPGMKLSEARWCAKMLFNIPTAYDIDGEIRAWRERYRPETVAAIREREQAFIKEYCKKQEPEHKQIHCPAPELKQMDMWEWMANNDG